MRRIVEGLGGMWNLGNKKEEGLLENSRKNMEEVKGLDYLVQDLSDVFIIISPDGKIKFISEAAIKVFGHKPREMMGKNFFDYCCLEENKIIKDMIHIVVKDPGKTTAKNVRKKLSSEENVFFEIRIINYLDEKYIDGLLINFRNISRRMELEERVDYIHTHDRITNLPNHIYFHKKMEKDCKNARKSSDIFALIMVDIDDFKYVNNTLGYTAGDQLIIDIGKRLDNLIDGKGCICRYLGDQFAIIVEGFEDIREYEDLAKRILEVFGYPFLIDKYEVYVTASLGISVFPEDGQDVKSLEKNANMALFYAKNEGGNAHSKQKEFVEKRRFFRVEFFQPLEGIVSIVELAGKSVNTGTTMILIENIGPGGLCFISNIKLPIKRDLILRFKTELVEKRIEVKGRLVWTKELDNNLSKYGVEFIVDENQRADLIQILNLVQIKMKNNILFNEGSFINDTIYKYFQDFKS